MHPVSPAYLAGTIDMLRKGVVILQVVIQKMPESLPEFEARIAEGRQPERICALFLCALALFDRDKDAGTAAMDLLRGPRPMTP